MAFTIKNFGKLGDAVGITLYAYTTSDTAATVDTSGYFNSAIDYLRVGDWIIVNSGIGGTPAYGIMVVNSNDGTNVDVADAVAFAGTDTD